MGIPQQNTGNILPPATLERQRPETNGRKRLALLQRQRNAEEWQTSENGLRITKTMQDKLLDVHDIPPFIPLPSNPLGGSSSEACGKNSLMVNRPISARPAI